MIHDYRVYILVIHTTQSVQVFKEINGSSNLSYVIRVLRDASEEMKDDISMGRIIAQDSFFDWWRRLYESKLLREKSSLDGKLLGNTKEGDEHLERFKQNKTRVDDVLEERLQNVERTLNRISEILTGDIRWRDLPTAELDSESDSGSTKIESELDQLVTRLDQDNDILLKRTK